MVHDLINMGQESHLVHFRAKPFWTLFISYLWSWGLLAPFPFHLFLVLSPSRHFISALGPSGSTALEFWHTLPLLNSRVSVLFPPGVSGYACPALGEALRRSSLFSWEPWPSACRMRFRRPTRHASLFVSTEGLRSSQNQCSPDSLGEMEGRRVGVCA